jgi:hypothetical protein
MFLFRQTVNSIVADISQKVEDLLSLAESLQASINKDYGKVMTIQDKIKLNAYEKDRAKAIAAKLENLISG